MLKANHAKNFAQDPSGPDVGAVTTYDGDGIRRVLAMVLDPSVFAKYRAFLQYKVVSRLQSYCTKALNDEYFDFFARKMSGQEEPQPEDKRSIGVVNQFAGEMMGKVFVAKYFPPACKAGATAMIDEVLLVMKESIDANDWLTAETKQTAQDKLSKFNVKVGYPDVWKDYSDFNPIQGESLYTISKKAMVWKTRVEFFEKLNSVLDRNEWGMTPQTVNAYFSPTQNEIVFPAAVLQPPFYHQTAATVDFDVSDERAISAGVDLLQPANFGGIGAVIAHEITHGYDDKGRKFDGNGNLNDWWTEADADLFQSKTHKMTAQVEKYLFVDTEDNDKKYQMNAQLTMGENLADLGGLSLSLKALKKRVRAAGAVGAAGAAGEGKGAGQGGAEALMQASIRVSFKAWANVWKASIKKDSRINRLTTDPHAPCEFRANLVNNMDEFYEAFETKAGDPMYVGNSVVVV